MLTMNVSPDFPGCQTPNVQKITEIVLKDRRIMIRETAEELNISFGSYQSILTDVLSVARMSVKFVPKLLNFDQKQHRTKKC